MIGSPWMVTIATTRPRRMTRTWSSRYTKLLGLRCSRVLCSWCEPKLRRILPLLIGDLAERQVLFFFIKQLIVLVIMFYCPGATGSLHHLLCIVGSTLVPCLHRRVYDLPCFGRVRIIPHRLIGTRISDVQRRRLRRQQP